MSVDRSVTEAVDEVDPPFDYPAYRSTSKRHPVFERIHIARTISEKTGPGPALAMLSEEDADLTTNAGTGEPALGPRTIVGGVVSDVGGEPLSNTLIEIWQANASGRYAHERETQFPAPQDPNFIGLGRCLTNESGEYRFTTIRPGPYPWGNHEKAWRPAHIHFSLMGPELGSRLVTQMYFPGDPLLAIDPIFNAVPEHARDLLVSRFDPELTVENWAVGFRFDIVLRGPGGTPLDEAPS